MSNQLTVELANPQSLTITISDIMGKRIFEKFYSEVKSIEIPLSELQIDAGIYNLSLMCGNALQNKKLVITK
ncbi:MAG: T9SS type A sorting domain-containing protein [Bacteroidetes bacterium]|nr:T9SS type A sorting domain-containing protein [Bacteroidota bacterium]